MGMFRPLNTQLIGESALGLFQTLLSSRWAMFRALTQCGIISNGVPISLYSHYWKNGDLDGFPKSLFRTLHGACCHD